MPESPLRRAMAAVRLANVDRDPITAAERLATVTPDVTAEARRMLALPDRPGCGTVVCPEPGFYEIKWGPDARTYAPRTVVWDPSAYPVTEPDLVEFWIDPAIVTRTGPPEPLLIPVWQAAAFVEAGLGHVPAWRRP